MDGGFECLDCGVKFIKKGFYKRHLQTKVHIKNVLKKCVRCDICEVSFRSNREYVAHLRTSEHLKKIKELEEVLSERSSPGEASRIDNPDTPSTSTSTFACTVCNLQFPTAKALSDHENTNKHKRQILSDNFISTEDEQFVVYKALSSMYDRYCLYMVSCKNQEINMHLETFMTTSTPLIRQIIRTELDEKKVFKVGYKINALYIKMVESGEGPAERLEKEVALKTLHYTFTTVGSRTIEQVLQNTFYPEIMDANEQVQLAESGWRFNQVIWCEVVFNAFDKTKSGICGMYIPLPKKLEKSHSIINVKNEDEKCFIYSILSHFFKDDRQRRHLQSTYQDLDAVLTYIETVYGIKLNFSDLSFPMSLKHVMTFEKNNPRVSVNVFGLVNNQNCKLYPLKNVDEEKEFHFDLLYLKQSCRPDDDNGGEYSEQSETEDEETNGPRQYISHYCLITNVAALLRSQRTSFTRQVSVCKRCLAIFQGETREEKLRVHKGYCNKQTVEPARYIMAGENEKFCYKARGNENPLDYYLFADFETMLEVPPEDSEELEVEEEEANGIHIDRVEEFTGMENTFSPSIGRVQTSNLHVLRKHTPICFASYLVSPEDEYDKQAMENVSKTNVYLGKDAAQVFINQTKRIGYKVMEAVNRYPDVPNLSEIERQIILFSTRRCVICEQSFINEKDDKCIHHCHRTGKLIGVAHVSCNLTYKRQNFLLIFFHNGSRYDFHLIMQSSFNGDSIRVIPHTEESYISFTVHLSNNFSLRFVDSYRFLTASLKNLSNLLAPEDFYNVNKHFQNDKELAELAKKKSFYPYEYVSTIDKFDMTELPAQENFRDSLTGSTLSDEDYAFAQLVWEKFDCQTLADYTKCYCLIDVLILSDVFSKFRRMCLHHYKLDPAKYITLPGYAFDVMKKMTGCQLDLFSNEKVNMYCCFETSVRGGITNTNVRYVKANSNLMPEIYDPQEPPRTLAYIDCNSMYSWAMQQALPISDFYELNTEEIVKFNETFILSLDDYGQFGYFFVADIDYPPELHDKHNDLPFLCERKTVNKVTKLMCTLENKTEYHVHYRMLKLALKHGLVLKKIHKIIRFKQAPVLKPYIDLNIQLRKESKSAFEKSMFKLMCNAIFGKTIENARNRLNFTLATNVEKYNTLVCHTNFKETIYFHKNLVGVNRFKTSVSLKLPIYLGASILDLSKILMYEFYYETLPYILNNVNYKLCYMDTDSFIFYIEDHSFSPYMQQFPQYFDLSDYPQSHELFNESNKKVPGVFKDELNGKIMSEFVSLHPKVYSYKVHETDEEVRKAKGVLKSIINKELTHDHYKKCLFLGDVITKSQQLFNVHLHNIRTIEQKKVALELRDNCKRFFHDNIHSYAYGHYKIDELNREEEEMSE